MFDSLQVPYVSCSFYQSTYLGKSKTSFVDVVSSKVLLSAAYASFLCVKDNMKKSAISGYLMKLSLIRKQQGEGIVRKKFFAADSLFQMYNISFKIISRILPGLFKYTKYLRCVKDILKLFNTISFQT